MLMSHTVFTNQVEVIFPYKFYHLLLNTKLMSQTLLEELLMNSDSHLGNNDSKLKYL